MNIKKLNEELERFLESKASFDSMINYLKEIGLEKNRGFFILKTSPEIRAWEFWREERVSFRCEGISLYVEFKDNIIIKKWMDTIETLSIDTPPEQILKTLQKIFNSEIDKKKKEEKEWAERQAKWNKFVKEAEKEWEENSVETNEILKALKQNGFTNFIFTTDSEAYNDFAGSDIEEFENDLNGYLDYAAETKYYINGVQESGLIIGDWTGTVSGSYLARDPDHLHDVNYEDERAGDIYLSEDTFDFILEKFPNSYLAHCIKG